MLQVLTTMAISYFHQVGPCSGHFLRWYYDPSSDRCREFFYRGCGSYRNNFASKKECERVRTAKRFAICP